VLNLVNNAIKFTARGQVRLEVNVDADSVTVLRGLDGHASAVLFVTDKNLSLGNPKRLDARFKVATGDEGNGGFSFADDVTGGLHGGFLPCFHDLLSHVASRFARPFSDNILCVSADFP
jgi:hypothetical protein